MASSRDDKQMPGNNSQSSPQPAQENNPAHEWIPVSVVTLVG